MISTSGAIPYFIDTDNALGSPFGDIDDAFALAALLRSGEAIEAVSSVFGNTFEPWAFRNNQKLASLCGYSGKLLRGAATWWSGPREASRYLAGLDHPVRVIALGPMTNLALALRENRGVEEKIKEIIFIGTNYTIPLPAFRFVDFNQWKDPKATRAIFASKIPLTVIPCDVARHMRVCENQIDSIPDELGAHLKSNAARWFRRSNFIKGLKSVPIWDLVAAMFALRPALFETLTTHAELGRMGQAVFGVVGGRPVKVVTRFDSVAVWSEFLELVGPAATG